MGLPALKEDYLFIGPLIVARLLDQVPDIPVDLIERSEQVLAADRRAKVIMVMWAGDRFQDNDGGRSGEGASQKLHQRWLVVYAVNNAGKTADARQLGAGAVLSAIHNALAGWKPEGSPRALVRANAPLQPLFTDSKAVYPLGFEVPLTL